MYLGAAKLTTGDTDKRGALELSPARPAVPFAQAGELSDAATRRDRFDRPDLANQLEVHGVAAGLPIAPLEVDA